MKSGGFMPMSTRVLEALTSSLSGDLLTPTPAAKPVLPWPGGMWGAE